MDAAGEYAEEMKDDVEKEMKAHAQAEGLDDLETGLQEELEDEATDEDEI